MLKEIKQPSGLERDYEKTFSKVNREPNKFFYQSNLACSRNPLSKILFSCAQPQQHSGLERDNERTSPPRSVIWDINTERLPQRLSHSIGCLLAHGARYTRVCCPSTGAASDQKHKMSSSHNGYSWPGHAEKGH